MLPFFFRTLMHFNIFYNHVMENNSDLLSPSRGRRCGWPSAGAVVWGRAGHLLRGSIGCSTTTGRLQTAPLQPLRWATPRGRVGLRRLIVHRGYRPRASRLTIPSPRTRFDHRLWSSQVCMLGAGVLMRRACKLLLLKHHKENLVGLFVKRVARHKGPFPTPRERICMLLLGLPHSPGDGATHRTRSAQSMNSF